MVEVKSVATQKPVTAAEHGADLIARLPGRIAQKGAERMGTEPPVTPGKEIERVDVQLAAYIANPTKAQPPEAATIRIATFSWADLLGPAAQVPNDLPRLTLPLLNGAEEKALKLPEAYRRLLTSPVQAILARTEKAGAAKLEEREFVQTGWRATAEGVAATAVAKPDVWKALVAAELDAHGVQAPPDKPSGKGVGALASGMKRADGIWRKFVEEQTRIRKNAYDPKHLKNAETEERFRSYYAEQTGGSTSSPALNTFISRFKTGGLPA
jgi:hypothetical protein